MTEKLELKVEELKSLMQLEPELVDQDLLLLGRNTLSIFFDPAYGPRIIGYYRAKIDLLKSALADLAHGGILLKRRKIGLLFKDNRILEFNSSYENSQDPGNLIASIAIKKSAQANLSEERKNAAIYLLIHLLADLEKPK